MERLKTRRALITIIWKILVVVTIFSGILLAIFLLSSYFPDFNKGKTIFDQIEDDTLAFLAALIFQYLIIFFITFNWYKETYSIENGVIRHTKGIFLKRKEMISLDKVESISVRQGVFGKLFDYGDIKIAQTKDKAYQIYAVESPEEFAEHMKKL